MTENDSSAVRWLVRLVAPLLLSAAAAAQEPVSDPREGEVPLPCAAGWEARLVLENGDAEL